MCYNKGTDGGEVEWTTSYKKAEIQWGRTLGNVRLWRKWVQFPPPPQKNFFKKMLDFLPGLWYYNTRKRKNPTNRKENLKMTFEYYEIYAAEWEAAQAFWAEEEDLAQMDADWEASGGHLWD